MKKFLNICIVFLLLFSTSGVAVSKHYCGEILQKIAFNGEEKSCCDSEEMPEDCCKNEVSIIKSDNLKISQHDVDLTFSPYILSFIEVFFNINGEKEQVVSFQSYFHSPPLIGQDIVIQVQAFLI